MKIEYKAIGIIHTPFNDPEGMPIQPAGAEGVQGTVELFPEYGEGLKDLEGFSHAILLYHFHRGTGYRLTITPFMDTEPRGLFATRAPKRPNPIGLSIVRVLRIEGAVLKVQDVDILDGTPLLDIKPYVPDFDHPRTPVRIGWIEKAKGEVREKRSDDRFRETHLETLHDESSR